MGAIKISEIHPLIADRVRLTIMATLSASHESLDFNFLLTTLELSKGNLSSHLRKLEDGGFIKVKKQFVERKPRTTYSITELGEHELKNYLQQMKKLMKLTE